VGEALHWPKPFSGPDGIDGRRGKRRIWQDIGGKRKLAPRESDVRRKGGWEVIRSLRKVGKNTGGLSTGCREVFSIQARNVTKAGS